MAPGQTDQAARPKAGRGRGIKAVESVTLGLAIALAAAVAGVLTVYHSYSIPGSSMAPTVVEGDYLFASNFAYAFGHRPQRGDLVIFQQPSRNHSTYIKRIVGLPGDRVQLKGGVVYVNGQALRRDPLGQGTEAGPFGLTHPVERFRETLPGGRSYTTFSYGPDGEAETTGVYAVPGGQYFVLGDNRDDSVDSRFPPELGGGDVSFETIKGRADVVISRSGDNDDARAGLHLRWLK